MPRASTTAVDRRALVGEDDGAVGAAGCEPRRRRGSSRCWRSDARRSAAPARPARNRAFRRASPLASVSRPVKPPGSERRLPLACAPPASSAAIAMTVGALVRQQDLAVAGERPEPRAAAGAIVEAGRGRHRAAAASSLMPSASLGRSRNRSSRGRSICPSRTSLSGPYFACRPRRDDVEGAVAEALARRPTACSLGE